LTKNQPNNPAAARLRKCPPPPARLSKYAREEWSRLAPVAHRLGTLTEADLRGFELLVETLATERTARETVGADGLTVPTADGGSKSHPAVRCMETARNQAARMLESFGLNPKGRGTVETAPQAGRRNGTWAGVLN
jgi:P27 family predicted phage terminase small subunit